MQTTFSFYYPVASYVDCSVGTKARIRIGKSIGLKTTLRYPFQDQTTKYGEKYEK